MRAAGGHGGGTCRARGERVDIIPEFNTSCYLTINDQVRGDVRCYPLQSHR